MAIPLSDFYAFSAATGSPVPEDEESRARIAPQVADWRRNQLKAPEQKSDFLSALGTGAAIAGLGAAALLGARALRRPQAVTQAAVRDVTPDVEQTVRRAATYRPEPQTPRPPRGTPAPSVEVTPPPSRVAQPPSRQPGGVSQVDLYKLLETERPQGVVVTDLASLVQPKPQVRSETRLLPAAVEKPDAMSFIGQYFQQKGTAAGSLTDFQRSLSNLMADQAVNAVDAAEDQMTGRVKQQLQRNEDLDMSQVDLMEEVVDNNYRQVMEQDEPDSSINQVAAQLPDGLPVDQAESGSQSGAQRFLQRQREEIASELGEQNLPITSGRVEQELANRFGKEAWTYGPKQTRRRQALELYAQTGDPSLLENIRPQTIEFGSIGELPVSEFKKEVVMPETAIRAEERYQSQVGKAKDWLGNLRVQLEPQRNKILQERRQIVEQNAAQLIPQLENARAKGQVGLVKQLESQLDNMRQLWRNPELGKHREGEYRLLTAQIEGAQRKINESISGIQKQLPTTLVDWSGEGMVVKPKFTSAPELEYEEDVLNTVEGLGVRQATPTEGELEYIPGGLLTGGRAKSISNVAMVDEDTGEIIPMNAASRTSIRGTGSMEQYSGDVLSSEGIYGVERAPVGAGAVSKLTPGELVPEANIAPSASPSSWRLPAGSRTQGKTAVNIVVSGGREYENYPELSQKLDRIISQLNIPSNMGINIVSGGARGADALAEKYAQERGYDTQVYPADWEQQGVQAGMLRNTEMAKVGDVLVAFPGGSGTENMIRQMTQDFGKPAYRAANIQEPTEVGRRSIALSEAVRKGAITMPSMQGPRESYTDPEKYFGYNLWDIVKKQPPQKAVQLNLPPDVIPSTAAAARVRTTPADIAAQQLGEYMAKVYKPRSTPLTSAAVIQPRLF